MKKLLKLGAIKEIEVFPNNIVEWWFVPIKTGEFKDLFCKIEDKKNPTNSQANGYERVRS